MAMNGIRLGSLQQSAVNEIFPSAPYIVNEKIEYLVGCMVTYLHLLLKIMHMDIPNLHNVATKLCTMWNLLVGESRA